MDSICEIKMLIPSLRPSDLYVLIDPIISYNLLVVLSNYLIELNLSAQLLLNENSHDCDI